jgi:hypothetical protein
LIAKSCIKIKKKERKEKKHDKNFHSKQKSQRWQKTIYENDPSIYSNKEDIGYLSASLPISIILVNIKRKSK